MRPACRRGGWFAYNQYDLEDLFVNGRCGPPPMSRKLLASWGVLVRLARIELAASCSAGKRSIR